MVWFAATPRAVSPDAGVLFRSTHSSRSASTDLMGIRANEGGHDPWLRIKARGDRGSFAVDIRTQDFCRFNQGYADTIRKSQGQAQPAVFHFVNPQQTDNQTMLVAFKSMTHDYRRKKT